MLYYPSSLSKFKCLQIAEWQPENLGLFSFFSKNAIPAIIRDICKLKIGKKSKARARFFESSIRRNIIRPKL
jgi:hypothetical protein